MNRRRAAVIAIIIVILMVTPVLFLKRTGPSTARQPVKVRIDTPLVLVRGERCLLTETKLQCKARVK